MVGMKRACHHHHRSFRTGIANDRTLSVILRLLIVITVTLRQVVGKSNVIVDKQAINFSDGTNAVGRRHRGQDVHLRNIESTPSPPNIILILTDDLGFGDLSCTGHPFIETPGICRLADEGTVFENFYMTGNVCAHSRSGLVTSRNPSFFPNYTGDRGLFNTPTIYNHLKAAGYYTMHVGKWHIGNEDRRDAEQYGIDYVEQKGGIDDLFGREYNRFNLAIDEIERHVGAEPDQPFYLNLWTYAPHSPIPEENHMVDYYTDLFSPIGDEFVNAFVPPQQYSPREDKTISYMADVDLLSRNVGRLLQVLDDLGIAENTVVAFSSDNGPNVDFRSGGYTRGLRGGKHYYHEGGIRVPFLIRWTGIIPAGMVNSESMFTGLDWLPTVCSLAGCTTVDQDLIEGEDMSDVWVGEQPTRSRTEPMVWRGVCAGSGTTLGACAKNLYMTYCGYKFHKIDQLLFYLPNDQGEQMNIYEQNPFIVSEFLRYLDTWETFMPAVYGRDNDPILPHDPNLPAPKVELPIIEECDLYTGSSAETPPPRTDDPTMNPAADSEQTTMPTTVDPQLITDEPVSSPTTSGSLDDNVTPSPVDIPSSARSFSINLQSSWGLWSAVGPLVSLLAV